MEYLFHSFVILIQRVRKQAFFKRFCFVTSKHQALVFYFFPNGCGFKNLEIG